VSFAIAARPRQARRRATVNRRDVGVIR
jgi:hypothetical protein